MTRMRDGGGGGGGEGEYLTGVYVADAEEESAAGAMIKWAYTVCNAREALAAAPPP